MARLGEDLIQTMKHAIVLCGGLGTRLRSRVNDRAKAVSDVAGRPFLFYILDQLVKQGYESAVLATGHFSESIRNQFEDADAYCGMHLRWSHEDTPLGTGGGARKARDLLPFGPCLLLNGDTFLDQDFSVAFDLLSSSSASACMITRHVDDVSRYGSVSLVDNLVTAFHEKGRQGPGLVNAGVYALGAKAFELAPASQSFSLEVELLQPMARAGQLVACESSAAFIDIGTPDDYDKAQPMFARMR